MDCGTALNTAKVKSSKQKKNTKQPKNQIDSYMLIGGAFVISLIIILLIQNSNREILEAKVRAVKNASGQTAQTQQSGQPPMEMMRKIQELKSAYESDPGNYNTIVQLGNTYFDIKQFQRAVDFYNLALEIKADEPDVLIDLGVSHFNLEQFDLAIEEVQRALKIAPEHKQGLYNAGIIYYNLNKLAEAEKVWQQLIILHGTSREAEAAKQFIAQLKDQQNQS